MVLGLSSIQSLHLSISSGNHSVANNTEKHKKDNNITQNDSINKILKPNDPLKNLMDQKQKIADSRQNYLDNALSKNESPQSIKEKLAEFDKQIAEIDKQINELKLEEQKKHIGTEDRDKKNDKAKNNSNNTNLHDNSKFDKSNKMMNDLVLISNNMSQIKTLSAMKSSEAGEIRVLKMEIKTDESRNPIGAARKRKKVAKLEDNIKKMEKTIGDKLKFNNSNNTSSNVTSKNEESKMSEEEEKETNSNLSAKDLRLLQTIQNYANNIYDKTKSNSQKLNSIA